MKKVELEASSEIVKFLAEVRSKHGPLVALRAILLAWRYTAIRSVHEWRISSDDVEQEVEASKGEVREILQLQHPEIYAPPPLTVVQLEQISAFFGAHGEA